MERNFLGLMTKESPVIVKEEPRDTAAFMGNADVQWTFSNKVSALPQLMPFKATHEERPRKAAFDRFVSSGYPPLSSTDAFDANHIPVSGMTQKSFNLDPQDMHFAIPTYPSQPIDAHGYMHFPISNHPIKTSMRGPLFKVHGTVVPGLPTSLKQQQPVTQRSVALGGVYASPRNTTKPASSPAQLTIFYAGEVKVYDGIPLEKAQEIMVFAAKGFSVMENATSPKPTAGDGLHIKRSQATSPASGLSSPMSPTSGSESSCTDELMASRTVGSLGPKILPETPKVATSLDSGAATMVPTAVPQARKASLARFLEKRKERVMSSAPYLNHTKSSENGVGSDGVGFSGKPSMSSSIVFPNFAN
eukprot:TRINITY_DN247_c0_g1_i1.p1 TRINITY_DN247_c0_g1~~TRINITY_DN247_c0_g1_i1.p1  ORF type:complete len:361 (+),score=62.14 TRINITY_DN247_c0_g1_i1:122-1204(+)